MITLFFTQIAVFYFVHIYQILRPPDTCIMGTGKLIRFWFVGTVLVIHV